MHFLVAHAGPEDRETVGCALQLAAAVQARMTVLKVVADPHSVGVIAELIATDEPLVLADKELQSVVEELLTEDISVDKVVRTADEIGKGIVTAAIELEADIVFLGTGDLTKPTGFLMQNDPVAHYVANNCPVNVVLVRKNDYRASTPQLVSL